MNKNFCNLFITKNQYKAFDGLLFKYSKDDFKKTLMLNVDVASTADEKILAAEICERNGIHYINKDNSDNNDSMERCIQLADNYLLENEIETDWLFVWQHDCVPLQEDFWDGFEAKLSKYDFLNDKVGMIGFHVYYGTEGGNKCLGRTELLKGVVNETYRCEYLNFPNEWSNTDYFVVESPCWVTTAINRKLFRKYIDIDDNFVLNLWGDDVANQFMLNGIFNITFPDLFVCHAHDIKASLGIGYSQQHSGIHDNDLAQQTWRKKYGYDFGHRRVNLREQFKNNLSMYKNTIQEKIFNMSIGDGPKKIEDFE